MNKEILNILKMARGIKPRRGFIEHSRQLVFTTHARSDISMNAPVRRYAFTFGIAAVFATIVISVSYFTLFTGSNKFDPQSVRAETNKFKFEIHLKEAAYFTDSAREIAAILDELDGDKTTNDLLN